MHPCLINRLALLFFAAGMRFSLQSQLRRKYKKNNHKKRARIVEAYIRDRDATKRNGTRLWDVLTMEGDSKGRYPTLALKRGTRGSNFWAVLLPNLRDNVAFSYVLSAASGACVIRIVAWAVSTTALILRATDLHHVRQQLVMSIVSFAHRVGAASIAHAHAVFIYGVAKRV